MRCADGEPRLSAKGHEVFAEMHEDSARTLREAAAEMPPEHPEVAELLGIAFRQGGAAKGHTFRSRELRYDAGGGHVPPGGWP